MIAKIVLLPSLVASASALLLSPALPQNHVLATSPIRAAPVMQFGGLAQKKVVKKAAPVKKAVPKPAAKKVKAAKKPTQVKKAVDTKATRPAQSQWDRKAPGKNQVVRLRAPAPKEFAYGLPGNYNIIGGGALNFDPYGFLDGKTELEVNRYRECELTHGRVGMLAAVGFIVQENFHPLFSGVGGPAIDQIPQLPFWWWFSASLGITFCELYRIGKAFRELNGETLKAETALRPGYVPGQIGFDPLGLAPDDPKEFRVMQEKELAHARLGMIAAAGFLAQEAVTKTTWSAAVGF
jgi:hypothetical protein